jgi:hypothetical protein
LRKAALQEHKLTKYGTECSYITSTQEKRGVNIPAKSGLKAKEGITMKLKNRRERRAH